jgi:hypothetical protein
MTGRRQTAILMLVAVACLGAAISMQVVRDRSYPREAAQRLAVLYVPSAPALRRIALSFDALMADVYWIRALQYYGGQRLNTGAGPRTYELLYPLLDMTTSLDPYFTIAYRFGAIFLSEEYPGGPGRPDQAIALLRKGIAAQPSKWHYYHDIAFVCYWQLRDTQAAADWFRKAASQPDAPNWLEPVAASMLVQGGDRASARFLLREILKSEEEWLRRMATRALAQVDALDWIEQLQQMVNANPPPEGQPYSWAWLIRRGVLRAVPHDPARAPFDIDPVTGTVSVARSSELFPMPRQRAGL